MILNPQESKPTPKLRRSQENKWRFESHGIKVIFPNIKSIVQRFRRPWKKSFRPLVTILGKRKCSLKRVYIFVRSTRMGTVSSILRSCEAPWTSAASRCPDTRCGRWSRSTTTNRGLSTRVDCRSRSSRNFARSWRRTNWDPRLSRWSRKRRIWKRWEGFRKRQARGPRIRLDWRNSSPSATG